MINITIYGHPVYNSIKKTLSLVDDINELHKKPKKIRFSNTHHFEYLGIKDFNKVFIKSP